MVNTLSFNLSAESRGAGSIPAICSGRCMSFSCAVKFPVTILYGVVICNFDEDLYAGYYVKHTNLIVNSMNSKNKNTDYRQCPDKVTRIMISVGQCNVVSIDHVGLSRYNSAFKLSSSV